jgi:hypothetical protein
VGAEFGRFGPDARTRTGACPPAPADTPTDAGYQEEPDVTHGPDATQRHFAGDEVERRQGETGLVLSVTLECVADGVTLALSVTLPTVVLGGEPAQAFRTFAVLTTIRGNIAIPEALTTAPQPYRVVAPRGRVTFARS